MGPSYAGHAVQPAGSRGDLSNRYHQLRPPEGFPRHELRDPFPWLLHRPMIGFEFDASRFVNALVLQE